MSNNEDTLMSKLLAETYTDPAEELSDNLLDLRKYFEKRLNQVDFLSIEDYLSQNHLSHSPLALLKETGCYRLNFKQSVLDFPSNWSIFGEIKKSDMIYLDEESDQDFLLDIFSEICGSHQNIALVKEDRSVQLIFLPSEGSLEHVTWMKNYFDKKKSEMLIKKEAA